MTPRFGQRQYIRGFDKLTVRPIQRSNAAGEMNKTEALYSLYLEARKRAGDIIEWRFQPMRFMLTHNVEGGRNAMNYTPDFMVVTTEEIQFHEVKGFMREDALLKVKMAAELFPWFRFYVVRREKGAWDVEEF